MSVELLQILSVVAYILAVVMLVLSIILFFVLNIRKVIGNLSGSTAKKAINDIRQKMKCPEESLTSRVRLI